MFRVSIDLAHLENQMRKLARIYGHSLSTEGKKQAGLVLVDCVKRTPPMEFGRSLTQKSSEQKKIGETAVNRDISRTFVDYTKLKIFSNPDDNLKSRDNARLSRWIRKLIREGRVAEASKLATQRGGLRLTGIAQHANLGMHKRSRDRRGRVREGNRPIVITDPSSIDFVRKVRVGRVGLGKSGWIKGAIKLGRNLPAWVSSHMGPGQCNIVEGDKPSIYVSNDVPYIQQSGMERRVVEDSIRDRAIKIDKEVSHAQAASLRKSGYQATAT